MAFREPAHDVERLGAVAKGPLDAERVQVLAAVGAVGRASPNALRADGPLVLDPAQFINLVNVHLGEKATRHPDEMHEVPDLPEQLLFIRRASSQNADRLHAVGADELNFAQLAASNALDEFLAIARMSALEAGGNLEVLLLSGLPGLDQAPQSRRVRRE